LIFFNSAGVFAASLITNGSFEEDGLINDIKVTPPYGWDVNVPSKFGGVIDDWNTHGDYSAGLYNNKVTFTADENAVISQQVDLTDANEIIFDINLTGLGLVGPTPWDGNKVTAFIKIDSNEVWESNISDNGVYYDVNIPVDSYGGIHTLSLGIRVNVSQKLFTAYWVHWDFVKFDAFCGGFGYFAGDLNRDCFVDFADVDILAQNWLRSDLLPADDYLDLYFDGRVNLLDFAILADEWMLCSDWQNANCLEIPLDLDADINLDGIVNFLDYNILVSNWGTPSDVRADIDGSKIVDYNDLAVMSAQWLQKSWLYRN
jgi:hypothetical protein